MKSLKVHYEIDSMVQFSFSIVYEQTLETVWYIFWTPVPKIKIYYRWVPEHPVCQKSNHPKTVKFLFGQGAMKNWSVKGHGIRVVGRKVRYLDVSLEYYNSKRLCCFVYNSVCVQKGKEGQ